MLIDFGNAPGQLNDNYPAIADDIFTQTGGHLDLVVMTHEHLDHIEGFYSQKKVFNQMQVDWVWMSIPSEPDYYDELSGRRAAQGGAGHGGAVRTPAAPRRVAVAPSFLTLLRNNLSNVNRIDYIRNLPGNSNRVLYLRRGNSVLNKPFSSKVKIKVLAPEKDMSVYYGGDLHNGLNALNRRLAADAADGDDEAWRFAGIPREKSGPPNLGPRDWRLLREAIQSAGVETIRAIDKAANNTSLAFVLEVAGRRLLFPGDAELESWAMMFKKCPAEMKPVDFLKVGHHGSHNGTPEAQLDKLLPVARKHRATVMVSTKSKVYGTVNPVPDADLMADLGRRCKSLVTTDGSAEPWIDAHL